MQATPSPKLSSSYDAVVVGAGPNGLAAAITLAQHDRSVLVLEANEQIGGAARSMELTRPGFTHDVGSAIHPLGIGSPFFQKLPLAEHGLHWIHPEVPLAHPLDDGRAVVMRRSLAETAERLGPDESAYHQLMAPLSTRWTALAKNLLRPLLRWPHDPLLMARFGWRAVRPTTTLCRSWFSTERARALFAGMAAHAALPLNQLGSSAFGLALGAAGHAVGWPMPEGGAQRITDALAAHLRTLGGDIVTGTRIEDLGDVPPARTILLNVTPRQLLRIVGERLPHRYRARLERFRYGPAVFKVDYALDGPIPWDAPACRQAGTVHLGGTLSEIAAGEQTIAGGDPPEQPFLLLAQHSLFDDTRAPSGQHTAWAYCHVPLGSTADMTPRIEQQIERYAPGFQDRILARHVSTPADLERLNANLVGGDIYGGNQHLTQLIARPTLSLHPYRTPLRGVYLCSSSTPPGGGVHGMCGYHAAQTALNDASG